MDVDVAVALDVNVNMDVSPLRWFLLQLLWILRAFTSPAKRWPARGQGLRQITPLKCA